MLGQLYSTQLKPDLDAQRQLDIDADALFTTASKGGLLDDCASESGLIRVHDGGWVVSVMICDTPEIGKRPEIGEDLISKISLAINDGWAPLYSTGETQWQQLTS